MADFSAVIRRAIEGLSANTPEERGRIYKRARETIQRQLDSLPEGMNRTIFVAQLTKIEDSILGIEQEYADGVPDHAGQEEQPAQNQPEERASPPSENSIPQQPAEELQKQPIEVAPVPVEAIPETIREVPVKNLPDAAAENVQQAVVQAPSLTVDVSEPVKEKLPTPVEISSPEPIKVPEVLTPQVPDVVVPEASGNDINSELKIPMAPEVSEAKDRKNDEATTDNDASLIDQAVGKIRSTLQAEASDKFSFSDPSSSFGFGEEALPEAPAPKPRKSPLVIIIAIVLLASVALAFFFWRVGWQGIQDMLPSMESSEVSGDQKATDDAQEQTAPTDQVDDNASVNDGTAANGSEAEKFTQRLNIDGSEVDVGPASDLIDGLPNEEGRSVAAVDTSDDASQSDPIKAQADDGSPSLQRMFFYETSLGLEQQARYEGSIAWSEEIESDATSSRPYIEGIIQVPERNLSVVITFKLNGDETLPVSHLIDMNFTVPEDFDGGEIEQITEVKFKNSEEQPGDRLEAISAKIDTSFFVVGLQNDKLDVVESNLQLMSQRGWIDIPITYTNGRKALITLEKGVDGKAIFDKVLAYWQQNPVQ